MEFHIEPLNINKLLEDVKNNMTTVIEKKSLTAKYIIQPDIGCLLGDRDKIIQVITNIMVNAVKYTPEDGSIIVTATRDKEFGTLGVQDTGKGIGKEDIPKVFDKFKQLENVEHHADGAGLGMSIAKSIVEHLGGSIWIEGEPSEGTTVYFTLPVSEKNENEPQGFETINEAAQNVSNGNNGLKKVLIVDDEKAMRFMLKECIEDAGYKAIVASGGEEALDIVDEQNPSLILLDVMMPEMSGIEVCRKLRGDPKTSRIKIIMVSARGQEKEKKEGLEAGADLYISKPFNYLDLLESINELMKE